MAFEQAATAQAGRLDQQVQLLRNIGGANLTTAETQFQSALTDVQTLQARLKAPGLSLSGNARTTLQNQLRAAQATFREKLQAVVNARADVEVQAAINGAAYLTSPERVASYEAMLQRAIASGRTGEAVGELGTRIEMMRRGYIRIGEGIFNSSGNGIDAVYRNVTTGAIAVVESKFKAGFNANWNPEGLLGWGYGFRQMSTDWIRINTNNALGSTFPQAQRVGQFLTANRYTERIIVVTNERGQIFFHAMP